MLLKKSRICHKAVRLMHTGKSIPQQPVFGFGIISQEINAGDQDMNADRMIFAPSWIIPEDSTLCYPAVMNLAMSDSSEPGTFHADCARL